MRLTVPDYYDRFRCIASRCTDNCCIGWEIGIDPAALADYQSQPGTFGDRLRAAIQPGDPPFFALTKSGRCPFLNEENLCDIYRQLGESHLCAICDQHPRFHNWFGAEKESKGSCVDMTTCGKRMTYILKKQTLYWNNSLPK